MKVLTSLLYITLHPRDRVGQGALEELYLSHMPLKRERALQ